MKRKKKSIATLCTMHIIFYAFVLVLMYGFVSFVNNVRFDKAFPSIAVILNREEAFKSGNYEIKGLKNAAYLVFDESTHRLEYSSSDTLDISYVDLQFINNYDGQEFYDVAYQVKDEKTYYYIAYRIYNEMQNVSHVLYTCQLDEEMRIVDGTLFRNFKKLSSKQLQLMQSDYQGQDVSKYHFVDHNKKEKCVVFLSPKFSYSDYDSIIRSNYSHIMLCIPVALVVLVIQILLFTRSLKKDFSPFRESISAYRKHKEVDVDKNDIPRELRATVEEFESLVDELEETKEQKEMISQDRQRIITNISHDLKTPLTVIRGYSNALLDHSIDEETRLKYLQTINDRAITANDLINSLFEYVKIDHPDYQINKEEMNLSEFMMQYFARRYNEIEEKGFLLEVDIQENVLASVDKQLITRVFDNLVDNCLKYNQSGTKIYVSLKIKKFIHIVIGDNGVGIAKNIQDNLFVPFVIGNVARTENKGTGIGLSFVERCVELHEGTIEFKSDDCYVTQFHIHLPI